MLTVRQQQVYKFITQYIQQYRYAPTEAEIAAEIGIKSRGVVHRYVTAIAAAGFIKVISGRRRNIQLVRPPIEDKCLPIVGKIAAGQPFEAIEQHQLFDVAEHLLGVDRFMLKVEGDSMIGDNIFDGDYIICEKRTVYHQDEIVIALIDREEATLKRLYYNEGGTITLFPSNPNLSPMVYAAERIIIQGVYVGLVRLTTHPKII